MNAAAWLVTDTGKFEHITPVLCDSPTADYFQDCRAGLSLRLWHLSCLLQRCMRAVSSHTWTHQLASCWSRWPPGAIYTKTKIGGRSSRVTAPTVWNSLPLHLHNATISERQFKSALKTHLFNLVYKWHVVLWELLKSKLTHLLTYLLTYLL